MYKKKKTFIFYPNWKHFLLNFMSEKNCYYSTQTRGLDLRVNPYNIIYTNQIKMLIYRDKNLRKNSRPTNCINAFSFQKKAIAIESDDKSIFAFHGHFMFYFGPVTLSTTRPLSPDHGIAMFKSISANR